MHIFRLFFVSTVLIPVLVVVATSNDDSGIKIRRPRDIVISEDGTRTSRRVKPVNISDRNCPALGCTGNLTTNSYNGKGSLATTILPGQGSSSEERFDSPDNFHHHHHPFKLEIKSIKNSTKTNAQDYIINNNVIEDGGTGRSFITTGIVVSWLVFWAFRAICSLIVYNVANYYWSSWQKRYKLGNDYVEYYVKLGQDAKHPFSNYGGGWNPTFGISLKTKNDHGWKGWPSPYHHGAYGHHHAASYHYPQGHWPPQHYGGSQYYGWPSAHGWGEKQALRHKYDKAKGWKYAKKYTKKYGKKAHKYGLRPSKYSHLFDEEGNIILGGKGHGWRSRSEQTKAKEKTGIDNSTSLTT